MTQRGNVPKRVPLRTRIYLPATIRSAHGCNEALIRDVSKTGALIESPVAPEVGSEVQVVCGPTEVEARVAWIDSTWFGIEFNQPLKRGFLRDQIGPKLKVAAPRKYRREALPSLKQNDT